MKKREQVIAYLQNHRPATRKETLAIEGFCSCMGLRISVSDVLFSDTAKEIVLEDFEPWFNSYFPKVGDVIYLTDHKVYVLVADSDISRNTITSAGEVTVSGVFSKSGKTITDPKIEKADRSCKKLIQSALYKKGKQWDSATGKVKDRLSPSSFGKLVKITVLGEQIGFGAFYEVDSTDNVWMYCWMVDGILDSLEPRKVGMLRELQFEDTDTQRERRILKQELKRYGLCWNSGQFRIEPINYRREAGEIYFYLSSDGKIKCAEERDRQMDTIRFRKGNYYLSQSEARSEKDCPKQKIMLGSCALNQKKK